MDNGYIIFKKNSNNVLKFYNKNNSFPSTVQGLGFRLLSFLQKLLNPLYIIENQLNENIYNIILEYHNPFNEYIEKLFKKNKLLVNITGFPTNPLLKEYIQNSNGKSILDNIEKFEKLAICTKDYYATDDWIYEIDIQNRKINIKKNIIVYILEFDEIINKNSKELLILCKQIELWCCKMHVNL